MLILAFPNPEDLDPAPGTWWALNIGSDHHCHFYVLIVGKGRQTLTELLFVRLGAGHTISLYHNPEDVALFSFLEGRHWHSCVPHLPFLSQKD